MAKLIMRFYLKKKTTLLNYKRLVRKNKINLVFMLLFCPTITKGQDIKATEIKVTEQFIPSVPDANKLNEQSTFADTIKVDKTQEYSIMQFTLETDYKTRPLKAAKIKEETISKLYQSKVSAGFGNRWTRKGTITYSSKRSNTISYGFLSNYFSNKFKIEDKQSDWSKNNMHLYTKKINSKHILLTHLDYERKTSFSYGHLTTINEKFLKNRFAFTKLLISTISKELSVDKLKHHTTFFVSDLNEMSENRIHLGSIISTSINGYLLNLDIAFDDYINYSRENISYGNKKQDAKLIDISPSTSIQKYGIDLDLGLSINYFSDAEKKIDVFPEVTATKELVKDILLVSAGTLNPMYRNTYKSLSDENLFIHALGTNQQSIVNYDTIQELNTTELKEIFFTIRNVLGKDEVFFARISYGRVENLAYFDNNYNSDYNRFLVHYIDVEQLMVSSSYERKINDIMSLNLKTVYYNWGDAEIAHKSNLLVNASLFINLRDKIILNPKLEYISNQKAFISEEYEIDYKFHFHLDIVYNYSKVFSAYLQLNNLTNSKKELWRDYQEIGFNGVFGLSYSF